MTTRALQIECLLDPIIDYRTNSIASGYTAYFYSAGTSNAKNVWTEKEKTNPYTSRTIGSDGTLQVYGDGVYRIIIKDTDSTTVYDWDDIKVQANTFTVQTKSAEYTATADDDMVLASGTFTVYIADVAGFTHPLIIKRVSGTITVNPYLTQTIDGNSTITLTASNDSAVLYPDVIAGTWRRADSLSGLVATVSNLNRLSGGYLHDDDDDTKVQVEESTDEDKVRIDVGGTEKVLISGTGTESYIQVNSIQDADGDTKVQVEESADEDLIRFDIGGTEQIRITDGAVIPTTDNDVDIGAVGNEFKDGYFDGTLNTDVLDVDGNADISGTLDVGSADISGTLDIGAGTTRRVAPAGMSVSNANGNPNVSDTLFDIVAAIGAAWESFGPTDSGATNIWTALDSVPVDADWIEVGFSHEITRTSGSYGMGQTRLYARSNGSSETNGIDNEVDRLSCYGSATSTEYGSDGNNHSKKIPVSSVKFDLYYSAVGVSVDTFYMSLVGWGFNP